jgi:alkaline phosphatase D
MLGNVTDRSASVWIRGVREDPITIRLFGDATSEKVLASAVARPEADRDFTAIVELAGLEPGTEYFYDAVVAGKSIFDGNRPSLRTYPPPGSACVVRVGFGGGAGFTPVHERMWDTIAAKQLDGFLFLGDNVYIDLPERPGGLHRYTYYRRQSRPEFRRLVRSTPVYAIWDDHDCAIDDCWMGPYVDKPAWKQPMLAVFRENWINPAAGSKQTPGCWFRFSIGNVDFFMLDCRFYRTNPFGKTPTMLGPVQKAWLHKALSRSRAEFKVLVSSVSWAPEAKPGSHDTWDGFPDEREEIFSWIDSESIDGVVLVSADRHRSDAWKIKRTDGYALYDLTSSRLTNLHTHECFEQALFCYNQQCSFGALTFDTKSPDPQVTFEIVNIDGKTVHALTIQKSQLVRPH